MIGYTTGVFDVFHIGHLNILRRSKEYCDYLIVGVSTDELVREHKKKKPIIPYTERKEIICSLSFVDEVVPQENYDKVAAWNKYKFNKIFVGDDWKGSERWISVEKEFNKLNVDVVYFPYTKNTSSSMLGKVLKNLYSNVEKSAHETTDYLEHNNKLFSVILRQNFKKDGIEFFTPDDFSQQLAYMKRPEGYSIPPHVHNPVLREVQFTQETLFIKSGKVRVDFYDDNKQYLESCILNQGDVILLATGGHGFEMLEESEIIEVKQGPYAGDQDKTRFEGVSNDKIKIKD